MTAKGGFVAAAVAGMFAAAVPVVASAKAGGKVHCAGANACSGKGACHSATNDCAGKNSCKGKGWIETDSDKDCTAKGGTVAPADAPKK